MIDQTVFKNAWALICERFGKKPSDALALAYYGTLSAKMTTEQFRLAAQRVFEEREFFPRPADFIDAVRPDVQASALEQWEQVLELMRGFPASLNEESKRVVRMMGGEGELRRSNVENLPFIRRDFMTLYGDAATIARREEGERIAPTRESIQLVKDLTPRLLGGS